MFPLQFLRLMGVLSQGKCLCLPLISNCLAFSLFIYWFLCIPFNFDLVYKVFHQVFLSGVQQLVDKWHCQENFEDPLIYSRKRQAVQFTIFHLFSLVWFVYIYPWKLQFTTFLWNTRSIDIAKNSFATIRCISQKTMASLLLSKAWGTAKIN